MSVSRLVYDDTYRHGWDHHNLMTFRAWNLPIFTYDYRHYRIHIHILPGLSQFFVEGTSLRSPSRNEGNQLLPVCGNSPRQHQFHEYVQEGGGSDPDVEKESQRLVYKDDREWFTTFDYDSKKFTILMQRDTKELLK